MNNKFILDACCGGRMMWFNKKHPNTIYIDVREGNYGFKERPNFEVRPDVVMDFRNLKFPDNTFKLIVFDPPHFYSLHSEKAVFRKKFGCLNAETWQSDLSKGFNECWRVLENYGVLIFKWNDYEIPLKKVLNVIKREPLFGQISTGRGSRTYWMTFMKIPNGVCKIGVYSLSEKF